VQQRNMLRLLVEGLSNREIAERLFISPNTVKDYMDDLMEKTGIHSRTALVAQASRLGIVVSDADRRNETAAKG
ncbi:MAG: response regulator transcription factor, partial [Clostridia bacterium]|nr:response regulator transcription factor [Clostridia bacterium]